MTRVGTAIGGCLSAMALLAMAAAASRAEAQPLSLRDHLFGAPSDERAFSVPSVARFRSEDGEAFVLDRSLGRQVLLRFDDSPEVWVLEPTQGPRGDTIYKNDMGDPVLRATRLGGLTLFTPDRPQGVAAAYAGPAPLLRPPGSMSASALLQAFAQASEHAGRAARRPVSFEADQVPLAAVGLVADAASVAAEAFVEVAEQGEPQRRLLSRFTKIRISLGKKAGAQVGRNGLLTIVVEGEKGLAGRPSSQRIAQVLVKR